MSNIDRSKAFSLTDKEKNLIDSINTLREREIKKKINHFKQNIEQFTQFCYQFLINQRQVASCLANKRLEEYKIPKL